MYDQKWRRYKPIEGLNVGQSPLTFVVHEKRTSICHRKKDPQNSNVLSKWCLDQKVSDQDWLFYAAVQESEFQTMKNKPSIRKLMYFLNKIHDLTHRCAYNGANKHFCHLLKKKYCQSLFKLYLLT